MTTATALLEALALCRQELPPDAHPIYLVRIQIIERLIKHAVEREPQFWTDTLSNLTEAEMIARYDAERDGSAYVKPSAQSTDGISTLLNQCRVSDRSDASINVLVAAAAPARAARGRTTALVRLLSASSTTAMCRPGWHRSIFRQPASHRTTNSIP
jgi:hypothetical protein